MYKRALKLTSTCLITTTKEPQNGCRIIVSQIQTSQYNENRQKASYGKRLAPSWRPRVRLAIPTHETHRWAMTREPYNYNEDRAYPKGFPVSAQTLTAWSCYEVLVLQVATYLCSRCSNLSGNFHSPCPHRWEGFFHLPHSKCIDLCVFRGRSARVYVARS